MYLSNPAARVLVTAIALSACLPGSSVADEPQDIGIPYAIESGTGKLLPLERQRINSGVHIKALGYGGADSVVRFDGKTSPVQIKVSKDLRFVVRFAAMPPTPSSVINLDALVSQKRIAVEVVVGKVHPMGFGGKSTNGQSEVQVKFLPGDNAVLFIESITPMPPGEYVITLKDTPYGFLFSIVP